MMKTGRGFVHNFEQNGGELIWHLRKVKFSVTNLIEILVMLLEMLFRLWHWRLTYWKYGNDKIKYDYGITKENYLESEISTSMKYY